MNLTQVLIEKSLDGMDRTAIRLGSLSKTYGEIRKEIEKTTGLLNGLGLKKGDRVALVLPKGFDFIEFYLAALHLGAVCLPLNPDYRSEEIGYFLSDSQTSLIVTTTAKKNELASLLDSLPALRCFIPRQDTSNRDSGGSPFKDSLLFASTLDEDIALLCYTSGTTGRSKGAMITHGNLISNMQALHQAWRWSSDDVLLHALPLFHVHGLCVALQGGLYAEAGIIMLERFDPFKVWETIEKERCTIFMGVPTMYQRLSRTWDELKGKPDLRSMRVFISGSAPLPEALFNRFKEQTGYTILERYGMTEAGMICSNPYESDRRKPQSVGYPLSGIEIQVVDQEGHPAAPGAVGEVWVRGNNIFQGYWRQPEKTKEAFAGTWFKSGDLGYLDPRDSQRLYLVGRAKELIITGGFNVYPKEVENILEEHEAVQEAAVFGMPHEDWGEQVTAAVVLIKEGAEKAEGLMSYCLDRLAGYKCPKKVFFRSELPRNPMGKLQKHLLLKEYQESR
jgi:malonyl-CoA/methylmalonyl-CoA synthetase